MNNYYNNNYKSSYNNNNNNRIPKVTIKYNVNNKNDEVVSTVRDRFERAVVNDNSCFLVQPSRRVSGICKLGGLH